MRASILIKPGELEAEREVPTPRISQGDILVKVKAALTCGTDLKAYLRGHPMIPMPGPFGHEFSGVVAATGKGVRGFKDGDEIMSAHSAPCLRCKYCRKKLFNLCENIMSTKVLGAFAEYVLIPQHIAKQNAYKKPAELSFEDAALLEPLACVVHGIEPLGNLKEATTLVIGSGPIGLLHAMLLKQKKALVAIADVHGDRLRTARKFGADQCIEMSSSDVARRAQMKDAIKRITGSIGFDHVFECTGQPAVWEHSVEYLRRGGTVTLFGGCPSGTRVSFDTHRLHYDELTLRGDFHFTPADVKKAYALLAGGKLMAGELISGSYPLKQIKRAFDNLARGVGIKYAIIP